jgi:outer membrane protein assembly factor BamB
MRTIGRILMIGAALLTPAACSLFKTKTPAAPRGFVLPLQEEARLDLDGELIGNPQIRAGKVYFSTRIGTLYAVDAASKKVLWKVETKLPAASGPSIGSDRLVFADKDNGLVCLALDGKALWAKKIPAKLSGEVVLDSGRIYLSADDSDLLAFNAVDGTEAWRFKAGGAIRTAPIIWNLQVIFGTDEGKIYVLDPQGRLRATVETGSAVTGPLAIEKNRLYFGLAGGSFRCLDVAILRDLWTVKTGGFPASRPAVDERRVYVATSNNVLFGFNKWNGNLDWWRMLPARSPFSPAVGEEQVFVASLSSVMTVLKKATGEYAGGYNAGEELRSAPVRIGDNIVIHTYTQETDKAALIFLKGTPPAEPAKKK